MAAAEAAAMLRTSLRLRSLFQPGVPCRGGAHGRAETQPRRCGPNTIQERTCIPSTQRDLQGLERLQVSTRGSKTKGAEDRGIGKGRFGITQKDRPL